jgi:BioD-like phosphotransacetylase family protein
LATKATGTKSENRARPAITVGELAKSIGGKIISKTEKSNELVENYMLGAMTIDSGLDYFGRKKNKAAILRQERLDMQLAALETSTTCLVISGAGKTPEYRVRQKAESRGIPIITTAVTVNDIVTRIDNLLVKKSKIA